MVWKRVLIRALFCPARLHRVPVELPSDACVLSTACCLSANRVGRKGGVEEGQGSKLWTEADELPAVSGPSEM